MRYDMKLTQNSKIVIAPDSFKGSISSADAANAIAQGIFSVLPDSTLIQIPVADGGEGTLEHLVPKENIIKINTVITDGSDGPAEYGFIFDTVVIEMAQAAGLTLVPETNRNPLTATTYGVGLMILDALNRGFRKFIITVGGSGTNDGGSGMLAALGAKLLDDTGHNLIGCGGNLSKISKIDITNIDKRLFDCQFTLACDVKNKLLGQNGATYTYGPQKGATDEMLKKLETGMANYSNILSIVANKNVANIAGSGAGGGIGIPLLSLFKTTIRSGIETVLEATGYYQAIENACCVITGEGRVDSQTLSGKAVSGVAKPANDKSIPVFVFAGCMGDGAKELLNQGIEKIYTLSDLGYSTEYTIANASECLFKIGKKFAEEYSL